MRIFIYCLIGLISLAIFYFSWLPHPDIGLNSHFPKWLGRWTNENGNLRTAVPFILLGAVLELQFFQENQVWRKRLIILSALLLLVIIAEFGQLFLPLRHFDIEDIFWGMMGSVGGIALGVLGRWVLKSLNNS